MSKRESTELFVSHIEELDEIIVNVFNGLFRDEIHYTIEAYRTTISYDIYNFNNSKIDVALHRFIKGEKSLEFEINSIDFSAGLFKISSPSSS